jgi:phage terminase large subunit-like protein
MDGHIHVECLDRRSTRDGNDWIIKLLSDMEANIGVIAIDGASGQLVLSEDLRHAKIKGVVLPTVKQVVTAYSSFEQAIYSGELLHSAQPSLIQAISNSEKRAIGSSGGFGYKSIDIGIDISILDSVVFAYWAIAYQMKKKKQQTVNY